MKSRILALLLIFVVALGLVPAVSAQSATPDLTCLGLAEADCALVKEASANAANIKSFEQSFNFSLKIGGLAAMQPGAKDITVTASGSGPISIDPANPTGSLELQGSIEGGDTPQSGSLSAVVVNGNLYVKNPKGEWIGAPLAVLGADLNKQLSTLPMNPATASTTADPAAISKALEQLGLTEQDFTNLIQTPGFLTHEKLADVQVNGVNTSPFAYTIDFAPLFNSADFEKVINAIVTQASKSDPQAAQYAMFLPLLKQSKAAIKVTQYISPEDKFVHQFDLDINASVDLSALMGASGASAGATAASPITLDLKFSIALDKINQPVTVTAPEGAKMATTSEEFSKLYSGG
jgi:hypothetical protein